MAKFTIEQIRERREKIRKEVLISGIVKSNTKAQRLCRQFFDINNITEKLSIVIRDGVWEVNGIPVSDPCHEKAFIRIRSNWIRRGILSE
jgi:hypothetical protein